jgi:hypothetical protein
MPPPPPLLSEVMRRKHMPLIKHCPFAAFQFALCQWLFHG